jgi:hypothetical protein
MFRRTKRSSEFSAGVDGISGSCQDNFVGLCVVAVLNPDGRGIFIFL